MKKIRLFRNQNEKLLETFTAYVTYKMTVSEKKHDERFLSFYSTFWYHPNRKIFTFCVVLSLPYRNDVLFLFFHFFHFFFFFGWTECFMSQIHSVYATFLHSFFQALLRKLKTVFFFIPIRNSQARNRSGRILVPEKERIFVCVCHLVKWKCEFVASNKSQRKKHLNFSKKWSGME